MDWLNAYNEWLFTPGIVYKGDPAYYWPIIGTAAIVCATLGGFVSYEFGQKHGAKNGWRLFLAMFILVPTVPWSLPLVLALGLVALVVWVLIPEGKPKPIPVARRLESEIARLEHECNIPPLN
jgi:MFS family permease